MKVVILLLCVVFAFSAFTERENEYLFNAWKGQFNKAYETKAEEQYRFAVFQRNLAQIEAFNADASNTFELGMNEFGDLTGKEFQALYLSSHTGRTHPGSNFVKSGNIPDAVDWRKEGVVNVPKDQAQCGSCWAFSAISALESASALSTHKLERFSEQQLVDCDDNDQGCSGGFEDTAYDYIISNGGIDLESCYPYTGRDGACKFDDSCIGAVLIDYDNLPSGDESALEEALANNGPVSIAIDAGQFSFQFYKKGVYIEKKCKKAYEQLNHAVTAVGYDADVSGVQYFIVRNSWGKSWGQNGYIWMARNQGNMCGIATDCVVPYV